MSAIFPILDRLTYHPVHLLVLRQVGNSIIDLNDEKGWTREQIADWVETVEEQLQSANAAESQPTDDTPEERQHISELAHA